jgi:hypothetical protein
LSDPTLDHWALGNTLGAQVVAEGSSDDRCLSPHGTPSPRTLWDAFLGVSRDLAPSFVTETALQPVNHAVLSFSEGLLRQWFFIFELDVTSVRETRRLHLHRGLRQYPDIAES